MENKDIDIFDNTVSTDKNRRAPEASAQPEPAAKPGKKRSRRRKHSWAFPLGLIVLALSLTGIWTVGSAVAGFIEKKTDGSEERARYGEYLTWVVANDPDSFDDISKANPAQLLDISILSLLYDDLNTNEYTLSDTGLVIPAAAVEQYYTSLFGTQRPIVHGTVNGLGYDFIYDEKTNEYTVPLTSYTPPFTPVVISVDKGRETVVLTVGYVGTDKLAVAGDGSVAAAEPDKYMNITLRKTEGEYRIYSIQATNPPETGA